MRRISKLLLTVVVMGIVIGTIGASTALAAPPSSGTPTGLSSLGTVVVGAEVVASGSSYYENLFIFSSQGPFYVQKVNVMDAYTKGVPAAVYLDQVFYDNNWVQDPLLSASLCSVVAPASKNSYDDSFGNIISVTPSTMIDPSGALAIPAASEIAFSLQYKSCPNGILFPSGMDLRFEATVLAPTAATVSICASESYLYSCPVT